jgi:hypothetical protein
MSTRTPLWQNPLLVGFLAGGWAATLVLLLLPSLGLRTAVAADPPTPAVPQPGPPPSSGQNPQPGPTVTPINPGFQPRGGQPVPGGGTSDATKDAIALAASIGAGESVVYYFDIRHQRLLVYQYKGVIQGSKPLDQHDRGGLRLLAARHIDYDLKLEGYRDLSESTRKELERMYDKAFSSGKGGGQDPNSPYPTKKVHISK